MHSKGVFQFSLSGHGWGGAGAAHGSFLLIYIRCAHNTHKLTTHTQHGTSIANVAARWVLQQPAVPAVVLGARNASHVPDHQRLFAFSLDGDDLAAVEALLADLSKAPVSDCYAWERGGGVF